MNLKNLNLKTHSKSDVQSTKIGQDTLIWQYSVVLPGAVIGNNCNINAHCFIENDVLIGDDVTIKCGVYLWDGITLEDNVHIGPNVTFTNDLFPRSKQKFKIVRTIVKKGASIGANSTLVAGITVGQYALIGAGSVVTKNVPNNSLWIGNPARHVGFVCNCGRKLNSSLHCEHCNSDYNIDSNGLIIKV
jgi:UDP-2-acetamido-3-amino-2,3-dideoxy-glucuronate N-acetyltransferase